MSELDLTKPVRTLAGKHARIICQDAKGLYPVIALVCLEPGIERPHAYTKSGQHELFPGGPMDLENAPEPPKLEPMTREEMKRMVGRQIEHKLTGDIEIVTRHKSKQNQIKCDGIGWITSELLIKEGWTHVDGQPLCKGSLDRSGTISDIQHFNRALTAEEIAEEVRKLNDKGSSD